MKALVTGGAGFIGSHIVDALIDAGHRVCIVDNLWEKGGGKVENTNPAARFRKMDIRSASLIDVFRRERPDIVYHQAAQHSVKISADDPVLDAQVNILGLINVLQCCAEAGVKKIIFASSGATHGVVIRLPITEETPQYPMCPYGITKMAAEHYLRHWFHRYGLEYTIFRYANVYGPRQDPTGEAGVVAIFAKKVVDNQTMIAKWDGEQTRDFVYVGDIARANLLAINGGDGEIYCLGTGVETSINTVFGILMRCAQNEIDIVRTPKTPGDQRRSLFDPDKAWRGLGWMPSVSLEDGLAKTVAFFQRGVI